MQGLNRQIRRMCKHFGYEVTKLERTRIMNVNLKGLPIGEWRDLRDDELTELFKLIENSSSDEKPQKPKAKPVVAKNRLLADQNPLKSQRLTLPAVSALLSLGARKRALSGWSPLTHR